MSKGHPNSLAVYLYSLVERSAIFDVLLAVILRQGPQGEPMTDVLLVARVNVLDVVHQVGRSRHAGVRDGQRGGLGLPQGRKRVLAVADERGNLHEIEGHLLAPDLAPAADQRLLLVAIL